MSESTKEKKMDQAIPGNAKGLNRKLIVAGAIGLGALLLIYFGFSIFYMNHFFFGTSMNGMNISGYSVSKVREKTQKLQASCFLEACSLFLFLLFYQQFEANGNKD